MVLRKLAEKIGARIVVPGKLDAVDVEHVYAGDRMSDLLNAVDDSTLLVTHIANTGLERLIELMDVPGVCLLNAAEPEEEVLLTATRSGATVMVSPVGMFETCARLYQALYPPPIGVESP